MKIIDRYIGKQVLVSAFFGVSSLSAILVLGNVLRRLLDLVINQGIPLDIFFRSVALLIPFSLVFTVPWGFVTAVLLVMGRMSAENELIAFRTAGLSILRISAPVFALAILLSGFCFWLNTEVAPRARGQLAALIYNIAIKQPQALFQSNRVVSELPDRRVYVGEKRESGLYDITVFELNKTKDPVRIIFAQRGELRADPENQSLGLLLHDAVIEEWSEPGNPASARGGITVQRADTVISLSKLVEAGQKKGGIGALPSSKLIAMLHDPKVEKPMELRFEIHQRLASSLACIAFALVGIPLAITAQRKETTVGFGLSLVIAFSYHFLITMAGNVQDKPGAHPLLLTWLSNMIFIPLGLAMLYRLSRR